MSADVRPGAQLGDFRILELVGRGGMGIVYLAEDVRLKRRAAVKVLAPELAEDETFRHRFIRESELAAAIDHPNIVPVYGAGEAGGRLWIAMRYVEGTNLRDLIARKGRLDLEYAVSVVSQIGRALDAANSRGLVHRDVKPGNILILPGAGGESTDHIYLTDFGLTKRAMDDSGLTSTGQFIGTIDFIAPEQIQGRTLDGRADQYSLACVLYTCLCGHVPFLRDVEIATIYAHLTEPPPRLSAERPDPKIRSNGTRPAEQWSRKSGPGWPPPHRPRRARRRHPRRRARSRHSRRRPVRLPQNRCPRDALSRPRTRLPGDARRLPLSLRLSALPRHGPPPGPRPRFG